MPNPISDPEIIEEAGLRWIHIDSPRSADRDWLEDNFDFHPLDMEDVYSRNQRPKLDQYEDYVFIVLHFPLFDKDSGRILTAELDLFLGPDYLITLPNIPLPPLSAMFERYREKPDLRQEVFSKGSGYLLYKIVDTGVDASFPMLRKTGLKLERLEDDIFEGRSSEIVRDLSEAKQEIINFRKIVRPQRAVLRDLERTKQRYLQDELEIYFDDISDAAERIWDTLENYKEVIEGLESTNESVLSHRLNDSFRILTAELDLFLGPDYLITLPNIPLPPLSAMFERYREKADLRAEVFSKGSGYLLYKIVDTGVDASFPMLRKTGLKLERLEDDIFEGRSSEIVRDLSEAKQEIINFRKIVRPQRAVLRDLERTKQRYLQDELEIYFDDISDAAERIWDTLENYKEVIEGLESTNESVLSHRLNDSFRILTAASVLLLPLTLIASIFGMNVDFPGAGEGVAFYVILALMAIVLLGLVVLFRRRGWL